MRPSRLVMGTTLRIRRQRPADALVRTRAGQMSLPVSVVLGASSSDMASGVFTSAGGWAIQRVAGLERVLERAGSAARDDLGAADGADGRTEVFPPRSASSQEPHAHRRRQGPRRRAPDRRDRLGSQGRPALPPRHRRGHPGHRPRRAALHPRVQAARPAQLRHRRGRGLTGRDRRAVHARASTSTSPTSCTAARRIELHRPIPAEGTGHRRPHGSRPCTTRARPPSSSCAPKSPTTRARCGRTTPRSSYAAKAASAANAAPPPGSTRPTGDPTRTVERRIREDQALLYRLSGDWNPLHADPEFAKLAGFDRPILHGLCTYGMTLKAVVDTLLGGDVARVRSYSTRFAGVVFPGETLRIRMWQQDGRAVTGDGDAPSSGTTRRSSPTRSSNTHEPCVPEGSRTMRAAVLHEIGQDKLEVLDDVEAVGFGPGKVKIRVRATGLCHSDLSAMTGVLPQPAPFVPGHEGAGEILDVGDGVTEPQARRPGRRLLAARLRRLSRLQARPDPAVPGRLHERRHPQLQAPRRRCLRLRRAPAPSPRRSSSTRAAPCRSPTTCPSTSPPSSAAESPPDSAPPSTPPMWRPVRRSPSSAAAASASPRSRAPRLKGAAEIVAVDPVASRREAALQVRRHRGRLAGRTRRRQADASPPARASTTSSRSSASPPPPAPRTRPPGAAARSSSSARARMDDFLQLNMFELFFDEKRILPSHVRRRGRPALLRADHRAVAGRPHRPRGADHPPGAARARSTTRWTRCVRVRRCVPASRSDHRAMAREDWKGSDVTAT